MALKFSIALCTFNSERFLSEQLASLQRQLRAPDELIICDDGSRDETPSVVASFARGAGFPVSFHVNPQRLGITANFERAISLCNGDVIMPCDHDDVWELDKLTVLERCFLERPDVVLAFGDLAIMTTDGQFAGQTQWERLQFGPRLQGTVKRDRAFELLLSRNVVTGAAMAFRSFLRPRILPIPAPFLHDEWIALIAAAMGRLYPVNLPLVRYRQHAEQSVGAATTGLAAQYRHARDKMGRDYFVQMVKRAERLYERLSSAPTAVRKRRYLRMAREKLVHARAARKCATAISPVGSWRPEKPSAAGMAASATVSRASCRICFFRESSCPSRPPPEAIRLPWP